MCTPCLQSIIRQAAVTMKVDINVPSCLQNMTRQAAVAMKVGISVPSLSTEHDQTGCSDHEGRYKCALPVYRA